MTGPPLPVSRGHAPARRELSSSDGGHPSGGQRAPQSGGAAKASTVGDGRWSLGRKALQSRGPIGFAAERTNSRTIWSRSSAERCGPRGVAGSAASQPRPFSGEPTAPVQPRADSAGFSARPSPPVSVLGRVRRFQCSAESAGFSARPTPPGQRAADSPAQRPATLATNAATSCASWPSTRFAGIWPCPRARPFRIASTTSACGGCS
jgi:hypothetical protein